MAKMTPSKEKMRLARRFAAQLQKRMGNDLKAVFVCGSVAANMAVPKSDIDLVVVCRNSEFAREVIEIMIKAPSLQLTNKITSFQIEETDFKDPPPIRSIKYRMLMRGAIPVFGKEYAMQHQNLWRYPNAETIKRRYLGPLWLTTLGQKPTADKRFAFKRRKTSRVPRAR